MSAVAAEAAPAAAVAEAAPPDAGARMSNGAIELMPMHASKADGTLPPLMPKGMQPFYSGPEAELEKFRRRSSGHAKARKSNTKRVDRQHHTGATGAVAADLEKFEAFLDDPSVPTGTHRLGAHASPKDAAATIDRVQSDIDREAWRWGGETTAQRKRRERRGVSDSLLAPTPSYLFGLDAVRDYEDEIRASGSLPDLAAGSDMSWILSGEMPDFEDPDEDGEQAKERKAAAKAAARERKDRADAIMEKRRKRDAAVTEKAAKEAEMVALSAMLRGCAEAVWFEHDSSGYYLARPVGEKLAGSQTVWTQEDEDKFTSCANRLGDDWFGACAPGWGFAMWPSVIPKEEMDLILSRLEGGEIQGLEVEEGEELKHWKVDGTAVVESWLASIDTGGEQLNKCFYAVRYKLGVDQNGPPSTAIVDACLALGIPAAEKPPEDEPLRTTVANLAEKAGVDVSPTVSSVVPAAIDAAVADCGVSSVRQFYASGLRDGKTVYVLQTPQQQHGATRCERAAAGQEWWLGFLLVVSAIRASCAAAVAADEDDFEAQESETRFNLHEAYSEEALLRSIQSVLESQLETKPDMAMVTPECTKLAECLRCESAQRMQVDALRGSVSSVQRVGVTSRFSMVGAEEQDGDKAEYAAQLEDCTRRLVRLSAQKEHHPDHVKLLATRAALHVEKKQYKACIDDCSAALAVAEGMSEIILPKCWSATVLRLRGNAYEQLQNYDASHADANAAFHLARSDPKSESAEVDYWLFNTETKLRWPALAAAAQPSRPLPTKAPRVKTPPPSGLSRMSLSESDLLKPSRRSLSSSASELKVDGPQSHCVRTGVSAEWLLAWGEANGLTGGAEWYTHCREGQNLLAHVVENANTNSKTALRATASVLEEQGLVRPFATLCNRVASWTGAKNKNGSAGDLGADTPSSSRVADVIKNIVVPATRLTVTPAPVTFAEAYMQEGAGGVGQATHLVIHARRGTWWSLVQACIVHTLGWVHGNEARSMTAVQLKKALQQHAQAADKSGGEPQPLYWLDFFSMPQHSDVKAPSAAAGETGAGSGLAAWREVLSEVKRCVLVVGEAEDVMGPAAGALTAPAPLTLRRSWCCTELLLASASRAEIDLALSFSALHALSERLNFRYGTSSAKVTNGIQSCWADWMPMIVLSESRCTVPDDTKALRSAVKSGGGGLNIADRKLRKLLTEGGTLAALGLLDYFKIHGGL